jgi:hypothetical protein
MHLSLVKLVLRAVDVDMVWSDSMDEVFPGPAIHQGIEEALKWYCDGLGGKQTIKSTGVVTPIYN